MARRFVCLFLILFFAGCQAAPAVPAAVSEPSRGNADPYAEARDQMVRDQIEARGVHSPDVLAAMRAVPRHHFVPADLVDMAYDDHPLPIGYGQTISQPYIVAAHERGAPVAAGRPCAGDRHR